MMTDFNFEQAMKRLTEISELLEGDTLPLDESITLFEEGLTLSKQCQDKLMQYEARVKDLVEKHNESQ